MKTLVRILGVAAVLAVACWIFTGAGSGADNDNNLVWKPVLEDSDSLKLAKRSVAILQEDAKILVSGKDPYTKDKDKKLTKPVIYGIRKRMQANGGLLAIYAVTAKVGPNKQELITLAELGLKISKAAQDKDVKPAALKKMADELANAKANANAKLNTITWSEYFEDQGDVMRAFKTFKKGGNGLAKDLQSTPRLKGANNGIEEKIKALARAKVKNIKQESADLVLMAQQIAAMAQLTKGLSPVKVKEGEKDPKDWKDWSEDMEKLALQLAAAAKKSDAVDVQKVANKLNSNCTKCHKMFKTEN